jgi:ethanolamine ammonia-lyase small subunit
MRLVQIDGEKFLFEFAPQELDLLIFVLNDYPLVPEAHHRLHKTEAPGQQDDQKLLEDALKAQRHANKAQLQALLKEDARFARSEKGFQAAFNRGEIEMLLQILNDVRIGSWRTETLLDFRLAHALARDAVLKPFQSRALSEELHRAGIETFPLGTDATDRQAYLRRPDLGRRLSPDSRQRLQNHIDLWGRRNLAVLVSDGLSALAAETQTVPTLTSLLPLLSGFGWTVFPIFIIPFARVKIQDEVGEILQAGHSLVLLGERPGLGSASSLGAYFTHQPGPQKTDADRNCISNIRPDGLPPREAAKKLARLLMESARLGISGVALKDTPPSLPSPQ